MQIALILTWLTHAVCPSYDTSAKSEHQLAMIMLGAIHNRKTFDMISCNAVKLWLTLEYLAKWDKQILFWKGQSAMYG